MSDYALAQDGCLGTGPVFLDSGVETKMVSAAFSSLKQFGCNSNKSLMEPSWLLLNYDTDGSGSLHAAKAA